MENVSVTSANEYTRKLVELEQTLKKSLNPVAPNPKFVNELNHKLYTKQMMSENEKPYTTAYLAISFGLLFGVFFFWLIRKIVRSNHMSSAPQS